MARIVTTRELANYLKLTQVTIYKYANEGKVPGFKVGSRWRFDLDEIDHLMKRGLHSFRETPKDPVKN
jgi:excisionase family DNA binding protein